MQRNFWKAASISLAAFAAAILAGFYAGFQVILLLPVFQITWTVFCLIRIFQLRRGGGHRPDAPAYDRESYGFALGGAVSSTAFLVALVVLTQIV